VAIRAGVMSAGVPRAFAPFALVATLLTSGAGGAAPADTTPADDCLAAPNSAAPPGSRWHYRLDRATQRKCWYVRAPDQPAQQAAAPAKKGAAKSLQSTPARSPPTAETTPAPVNSGDRGRLPPHVEVPAVAPPAPAPVTSAAPQDTALSSPAEPTTPASASVEPSEPTPSIAPASSATTRDTAPSSIPGAPAAPESATSGSSAGRNTPAQSTLPAIDATADKSAPQTSHEEIATSIPAASTPPASTPSETTDQATARRAVTPAPLAKAQAPPAVPTDAPAPVSDDGKRTAGGGGPISIGMLIMCSLILGIALLRLMWRVTRKDAAARSDQIFTDNSWFNPYEDPEFCRQLRQGFALHPRWEQEDTAINQPHLRV
jgi:hypothetical protein